LEVITKKTETGNGSSGNSESPESDNQQTNNLESSGTTGDNSSGDNMKNLGKISLDYSKISSGIVVVLVGGVPLLEINLHWVLSHLSRNSRKSLSKWLQQKSLGESPWPLHSPTSPGSSNDLSGNSQQHQDSPIAAVDQGTANSKSNNSSRSAVTISPAFNAFILKLLKACGLSSINHSNSIFDSLRIWITKNNPRLYTPSTDSKKKTVYVVNLDSVVQKTVDSLKLKRKKTNNSDNPLNSSKNENKSQ
jgi:hypothetical protein